MLNKRQLDAIKFVIDENGRILNLLRDAIIASCGIQEIVINFDLPVTPIDLNMAERLEIIRVQCDELRSAHFNQLFPKLAQESSPSGDREGGSRAVMPAPELADARDEVPA